MLMVSGTSPYWRILSNHTHSEDLPVITGWHKYWGEWNNENGNNGIMRKETEDGGDWYSNGRCRHCLTATPSTLHLLLGNVLHTGVTESSMWCVTVMWSILLFFYCTCKFHFSSIFSLSPSFPSLSLPPSTAQEHSFSSSMACLFWEEAPLSLSSRQLPPLPNDGNKWMWVETGLVHSITMYSTLRE